DGFSRPSLKPAPASSSSASQHASSAQGNKEAYSSSALARCGVLSSSLSRRSLRVFPSLNGVWQQYLQLAFTIMMVVWSGGPFTPAGTKVFDGASNRSPSTCLKTPKSGFLEEAEAVPAESNGPQRKTTRRIRRSLYQLQGLKRVKFKRIGEIDGKTCCYYISASR